MAINESVSVFRRTLDERFSAFKDDLVQLMNAMSSNNIERKSKAAAKAKQSAIDLQRSLSSRDQPPWLAPLLSILDSRGPLVDHDGHAGQLVLGVAAHYAQIMDHQWSFEESDSLAFDFDAVFESFREQSRIPDLFDRLIGCLEKIIACEEVDSRRVVQTLENLIRLLKKNRHGSYFSTIASWDFVTSVLRKWLWEELSNVAVLGSLLKSFRETLKETDDALAQLHQGMQEHVRSQQIAQIKVDMIVLNYSPRANLPPKQLEISETLKRDDEERRV